MLWQKPKNKTALIQAENALTIARKIIDEGFQSYLIGGIVRDALLGISTLDADICTNCPPEIIEKILPDAKRWGPRKYCIFTLKNELGSIEIAHFRRESMCDGRHCSVELVESIEDDVARRDFTVNAIAVDPISLDIIDLVGGIADLSAKIVRTIGNPRKRFIEDRLRMLRAIRFSAKLNFSIEENTLHDISHEAKNINSLSPDRIREEIVLILRNKNAGISADLLAKTSLWENIFPEISRQPRNPEWKTKIAILNRASAKKYSEIIMWSLFLSPVTEIKDRDYFAIKNILTRLKFPKFKAQQILWLVKSLIETRNFDVLSPQKAIEIADSKHLQTLLKIINLRNPNDDFETDLLRRFPNLGTKPFLTGKILQKSLENVPQNEIRSILIKLRNAELSGKIVSRKEAKKFIENNK